ncbi:MAG: tetratricopeptide repeat protein, partial [Caldilinea sp.]
MERVSEEFKRALSEGAWLLRSNRPQVAVEKLLPLYEQAPTNADVAINLGGAYILLARWNQAVRVLSKATELHQHNPMLWCNLAAAYLGRLELAGPQQPLPVDPTVLHLGDDAVIAALHPPLDVEDPAGEGLDPPPGHPRLDRDGAVAHVGRIPVLAVDVALDVEPVGPKHQRQRLAGLQP